MRTVFADACYWIALLNPKDPLHDRAIAISKNLKQCRIVTSEMTLTEFLNGFGKLGADFRQTAVEAVQALLKNPNADVVPQTSLQFQTAMTRYAGVSDKEWGLTDCASFDIMRENGLTEALTYDQHFVQAGFTALLRD